MTDASRKKSAEGRLPQALGNKEWLLKAFTITVDRLNLSPDILKKNDCERCLAHIDEARLFQLSEPLSLLQPAEISAQLEKDRDQQVLYSRETQQTITSWSERHQAVQVISELSKATSMLLGIQQQGNECHLHTALRTLTVICMLAFVPGNEKIKGDLAMILRSSPEDMPGMIRRYAVAVGSKAKVVTLVDERIEGDPIWSSWAEQLLQEIQDLAIFYNVSTEVGIPESSLPQQVRYKMSADNIMVSMATTQEAGAGSNPSSALHALQLIPLSHIEAKNILVRNHYLHSLPGGTKLSLGIFLHAKLLGALTFGVGPYLGYKIVNDASPDDVVTLTRLWLSDDLPPNSESKVLGIALRSLKRDTSLKFILAYSDPSVGHLGTIYQATNWLYTGLSTATPLYDIGDGILHHSRSLAHSLGSHSIRYLTSQGIDVKTVPQSAKHRYVYFLDQSWSSRLSVSILPYPKKELD